MAAPIRNPENSDDHFDAIIVGFGAAGAVAALEVAARGGRALIVEKMDQPGGISILSGGGLRICFDVEKAFQYLQFTCGGRAPEAVLRALATGMFDLPNHLDELAKPVGAKISVRPAPGNYPFPGYDTFGYATIESIANFDPATLTGYLAARPLTSGCFLFKTLFENVLACMRDGTVELRLSTRATGLIRTQTGEICGVSLTRGHRSTRAFARRAVVLASGGFEADEDMKRKHLVSQPVLTGSYRGNTGDGIRMAQSVGADLWHMWHCHGPYGIRHTNSEYPFGIYVKGLPTWTPGLPTRDLPKMAWIIVDQFANRYANEYPPYLSDTGHRLFDHFDATNGLHSRTPSYLIFDEAGRKMYPIGRSITNDPSAFYEWSQDNLREVENGILTRADSIPQLAEKLSLDPAALARSVVRWNDWVGRGADGDHGRPAETMVALTQGPFYGVPLWPMVINTQGGPVHDERQRIIDPYGQPIARLYAAGELGSVFGHVYISGGNLAECFVGGRIAARDIMSLAPLMPAHYRNTQSEGPQPEAATSPSDIHHS